MAEQLCATTTNRDTVDLAVLRLAHLLGQAAARAALTRASVESHPFKQEISHVEKYDHESAHEAADADLPRGC